MEKSQKIRKVITSVGALIVSFILGSLTPYISNTNVQTSGNGSFCNTAVIPINGQLVTYQVPAAGDNGHVLTSSDDLVSEITNANMNANIRAIILPIDSYGGTIVAGQEVAEALKESGKPTIALIRGQGDSAAYWAATGASTIFASENSEVGSIGVTLSYVDNVVKNQKDGLTYNQLITGKYKDTGDPNRSLTPDDKQLLFRDLNIIFHNFINTVSNNRKIDPLVVEKMADGSTLLGQAALKEKLIDHIGGIHEVKEYLKNIIGEEVSLCSKNP